MALWNVIVQYDGSREHLRAVVEAPTEQEALSASRAMGLGSRSYERVRVEIAQVQPMGRLKVPVNAQITLDAGGVFSLATGQTVVLASETSMFEQLVAHLLRQPGPPRDWQPGEDDLSHAAARVVFRWGFYLAALMDTSKPTWKGVQMGCSRFGDSEQARMNIELSANMEAWHRLALEQPARLRHVTWAARNLHGPETTDDMRTVPSILDRLEGSEEDAQRNMLAQLKAEVPELAVRLDEVFGQAGPLMVPSQQELAAFRLNPIRRIVNCLALVTWRTPLEYLHGDQANIDDATRPAKDLLTCRFTPEEVAALEQGMAEAAGGFVYTSLALQDWDVEGADLAQRLAKVTIIGEAGSKWSITERSRGCLL